MVAKDVMRLDSCQLYSEGEDHTETDDLPIQTLVKIALFQDSPLNQKRVGR